MCIRTLREKPTAAGPYLSSPASLHRLDLTTSAAPERVFHSARAFHTSVKAICVLQKYASSTEQHMAKETASSLLYVCLRGERGEVGGVFVKEKDSPQSTTLRQRGDRRTTRVLRAQGWNETRLEMFQYNMLNTE